MNLCLERLQNEFANAGVEYEVIEHAPAYTAQEAAGAARVSGYMFAKTTMVMADGVPALLALQAPYEVDFETVRKHLAAREVRLARPEEFVGLFPDSESGAMPPFPVTDRVRVYADSGLVKNDRIVFAAGCHAEAIRMPVQDYLLFAAPDVFDFARSVSHPLAAEEGAQSWARWLKSQAVPAGIVTAVAAGALIRRSLASPSRVQRLGQRIVPGGVRATMAGGSLIARRSLPRPSSAQQLGQQLIPGAVHEMAANGGLIARRSLPRRSQVRRLAQQLVPAGVRALNAAVRRLARRPRQRRGPAFMAGTAAGFLAAGLLDPTSGRRRRAVLRDKVAHTARANWRKVSGMARYSLGGGRGVLHWLQTSRVTAGLRRAVPATTQHASAAGANGTTHRA